MVLRWFAIVLRRLRREDNGSELIEFALVSILFFSLLFGVLEFGRAIWVHNNVAHLAREGARYALVRGTESGRTVSPTDVTTYVNSRAGGLAGVTVTTSWDGGSKLAGSVVQVRVSYPFTVAAPFVPLGPIELHSTSRMVISY